MYLHIGGGHTLAEDEIIGVFDLDGTSRGKSTLDFLRRREREGKLAQAGSGAIPRSFILTADTACLSPITAATLIKRLSETGIEGWIK